MTNSRKIAERKTGEQQGPGKNAAKNATRQRSPKPTLHPRRQYAGAIDTPVERKRGFDVMIVKKGNDPQTAVATVPRVANRPRAIRESQSSGRSQAKAARLARAATEGARPREARRVGEMFELKKREMSDETQRMEFSGAEKGKQPSFRGQE